MTPRLDKETDLVSAATKPLNRDTQLFEVVLESVFGVPFEQIKADQRRMAICEEADLHQQGRQILHDMVRMARGEISSIRVPRRLPRRGEYSDIS